MSLFEKCQKQPRSAQKRGAGVCASTTRSAHLRDTPSHFTGLLPLLRGQAGRLSYRAARDESTRPTTMGKILSRGRRGVLTGRISR